MTAAVVEAVMTSPPVAKIGREVATDLRGKTAMRGRGNNAKPMAAEGKTPVANRPETSAKPVANPEVETRGKSQSEIENDELFAVAEDIVATGNHLDKLAKGWRIEQNSDGCYRWRYQLKDDNGESIKYTTKSGNVGYKRGSEYVRNEELPEIWKLLKS